MARLEVTLNSLNTQDSDEYGRPTVIAAVVDWRRGVAGDLE